MSPQRSRASWLRQQRFFLLLALLFLRLPSLSSALQSTRKALRHQRRSNTVLSENAVSKKAGETALSGVQWLGNRLTDPDIEMKRPPGTLQSSLYFGHPPKDRSEVRSLFEMADDYETEEQAKEETKKKEKVDGTGGSVYSSSKRQLSESSEQSGETASKKDPKQKQVWEALASLEADSTLQQFQVLWWLFADCCQLNSHLPYSI